MIRELMHAFWAWELVRSLVALVRGQGVICGFLRLVGCYAAFVESTSQVRLFQGSNTQTT